MLKYRSLNLSHTGTESDVTTAMRWLWQDFIFSLRLEALKKEAQLYDLCKSQGIQQKPQWVQWKPWILETYIYCWLGLTSLCLGLIKEGILNHHVKKCIMLYFQVPVMSRGAWLIFNMLSQVNLLVTHGAVLYLRPLLTGSSRGGYTFSPLNVTSLRIDNDKWNYFGQRLSESRAALREELDVILIY